jgi:ABC-2 type transport system permease protein
LENQRYDTDLLNPTNLLAGNLDFGFIIIYLFPLLIIAFCYNILSEEKEEGTWSLISLQSSNPTVVLYYKFAIRALVCFAALFFLFGLACISLGIPLNERLALVVLIASLYLLFWFATCYFISSFQKNSSTNALLLLSTWILLTMILPAMANNYILTKYPAPEALEMMVEQREGYHEKWDMKQEVSIEKFYSHYPQYKKHGIPEGQFNWLWYYAMQQSGDDDAAHHTAALREKLLMREKVNRSLSMFNPSMHALFHFNRLAASDLGNQIRYLDAVAAYHEKLRLHFYPMIFENKPVDSVDWNQFKVVYFKDDQKPFWILSVMPLLFFIGLLTFIGHLKLRKLSFV